MILPTKLFHYSSNSTLEIRQDLYNISALNQHNFKPEGLWISIEDYGEDDENWKSWCEGYEFRCESLKYRYAVYLKEQAKILHLSSVEQLEKFFEEYRYNFFCTIHWGKVMQKYDGIFIAPYHHTDIIDERFSWYYGWDCSSGCIWNTNIIESFMLDSVREEFQKEGTVKGSQ